MSYKMATHWAYIANGFWTHVSVYPAFMTGPSGNCDASQAYKLVSRLMGSAGILRVMTAALKVRPVTSHHAVRTRRRRRARGR